MIILPDLSDLVIEQVSVNNGVTVTVHAASPTAPCPCGGTVSKKIQSRYTRTLRDFPVSGHAARLIVQVRRFFCQEDTCVRKIFAERFPSLTLPRVTFTLRLQETLRQMGFVLGGEAGARLGTLLNMPGSPDTLLRLVKQSELPVPSSPRVVGLDDWSWKRRLRYGTLICDLERGIPIDVLSDREVKTVSGWLEKHPSIEIVSRDRSSEYAAAISKGAPQAIQIADCWHMAKNVAESVSTLLARCRADIRRALQAQETSEPERVGTVLEPEKEMRLVRSRSVEQARLACRTQKQDRYAQVLELHHQGVKPPVIASRIGIGERTVWRWLAHGSFPEAKQRRRRPSLIDRYERSILARWQEGCHNGSQLYKELTAQGYSGSPRAMYSYLAMLRTPQATVSKSLPSKQREQKNAPAPPALLENFSTLRATWLFVCQPDDLDETSREALALLRRVNPSVEVAYHLTQTFMSMLRERTGEISLESWLQEADACHLPEFQSIARGIQKDKAAVLVGLTLAWSNGPTEGHVNRLKLIKRSMYGRAKLNLLRQRVLHVA